MWIYKQSHKISLESYQIHNFVRKYARNKNNIQCRYWKLIWKYQSQTNRASTQRPGDVPWMSRKGPNVRNVQWIFRDSQGTNRKIDFLMKKLFFRSKSRCITYPVLFFTTLFKLTSHIPANNPHPTSRTPHIPNIPHHKHPTSQTFHITNIPRPEHLTSRTSHIPNIPHSEHPTSRTSHIPNIRHPEHPTSRTSHIPNIPHPTFSTPQHSTFSKCHLLSISHSKHATFYQTNHITWVNRNKEQYFNTEISNGK